jgi:hypothetical protein
MIGVVAGQEVGGVSCVYPLDDDGTLATALGYGYAGPAVGDGQRMQYTLGAGGGVKILVAGAATTTARFQRGELPIGFEAVVNDYAPTPHGLAFVITDGAGAVINAVTMFASAVNDVLQMELSASGVLTAKKNGVAFDLSSYWRAPAGQKTVGASDYFAPYLWLTDQAWAVGEVTDIQLRTCAASLTGTYSTGCTDIAGTVI